MLQVYNPDLISSSSPDVDPCEACQGTACQQGGASTEGSSSSPALFIAGGGGGLLLLAIVVLLLMKRKAAPAYNSELGTAVDASIWEMDCRLVRLADKLGVSARVWRSWAARVARLNACGISPVRMVERRLWRSLYGTAGLQRASLLRPTS